MLLKLIEENLEIGKPIHSVHGRWRTLGLRWRVLSEPILQSSLLHRIAAYYGGPYLLRNGMLTLRWLRTEVSLWIENHVLVKASASWHVAVVACRKAVLIVNETLLPTRDLCLAVLDFLSVEQVLIM